MIMLELTPRSSTEPSSVLPDFDDESPGVRFEQRGIGDMPSATLLEGVILSEADG